jgi:hypothetical protein
LFSLGGHSANRDYFHYHCKKNENTYRIYFSVFFSSQNNIDCYSAYEHEELNLKLNPDADFKIVKSLIGVCYSNYYFSLTINGSTTVYPILNDFIDRYETGSGYQAITFSNERTYNTSAAKWKVDIIYEKPRQVMITNSISGQLNLMTFTDKELLAVQRKNRVNVDSLGTFVKKGQ